LRRGTTDGGKIRGLGNVTGQSVERLDALLRRWPSATIALLLVAAAFSALFAR
jgi:hypothetical protein